MTEMISYCGLVCSSCQIYLAGRETDKIQKEKMLYKIIEACKAYYGVDYKIEEINECDGCKSGGGRLFFACMDCKIKKCAEAKRTTSCAYCEDYPCEELAKMFKVETSAKERLDNIRSSIQ